MSHKIGNQVQRQEKAILKKEQRDWASNLQLEAPFFERLLGLLGVLIAVSQSVGNEQNLKQMRFIVRRVKLTPYLTKATPRGT